MLKKGANEQYSNQQYVYKTMVRNLRLIYHRVAIQGKVKYFAFNYVSTEDHLTRLYVHLYIRDAKQNIILT